MASGKRTTLRYRFSVPDRDTAVREWLAEQDHPSLSLRILIKEEIARHGLVDTTCRMMEVGPSGGTRSGKPGRPAARDSRPARQAVSARDVVDGEPEAEFREEAVPVPATQEPEPVRNKPVAVPVQETVKAPEEPVKKPVVKPAGKTGGKPVPQVKKDADRKVPGQEPETEPSGDGGRIQVERPQDPASVRSVGTGSGESMENLLAMTANAQSFSGMLDLDDDDDGDDGGSGEEEDGRDG